MSQKKRLFLSLPLTIGFLLFSYWVTNLRFPISGEKLLLTKIEKLHYFFWPRENNFIDSVLFINVTYDKELRTIVDEDSIPLGKTHITDRHKLLRLLQYLQEKDEYKYILLDVFFGNDVSTEWDEELFATIESMPRIVIPCHSDEKLADKRLMKKAGLADYLVTFSESDFVKYPYFCDTAQSMPVKMYEDITGRKIKKHGIFYTDGWHIVRSSIVLTFELQANKLYADDKDVIYADTKDKIWLSLGMDLLDDSIPEMDVMGDSLLYKQPDLTRNKYIVIGSFKGDDTHNTFLGDMPGSIINFNAFISLLHNHHIVSVSLVIFLFFVFFFMSYLTLSRKKLQDLLKELTEKSQNKRVRKCLHFFIWLCSWIGYSSLLSILCITTYIALGEAYDIFITSTMFYLLSLSLARFNKIYKLIKKWYEEEDYAIVSGYLFFVYY